MFRRLSIHLFVIERITANIGEAKNIPNGPAIAPPTVIAEIIQNGVIPIDSPNIFGPRYRPSNC